MKNKTLTFVRGNGALLVVLLAAFFCAMAASHGFAVTQSDSLFTDAGTEITGLSAQVKTLLGLALAPILLFLGWKYFKRAKSAA
jgi:hypothetical protein